MKIMVAYRMPGPLGFFDEPIQFGSAQNGFVPGPLGIKEIKLNYYVRNLLTPKPVKIINVRLAAAGISIDGSNDFKGKVKINLSEAKNSSRYLFQLINSLQKSSSTITIQAITNEESTWHKSGQRSRSHTEALDNKRRSDARSSATNSIIYMNENRVNQTHRSYNSGTLIHELVHAHDLAYGKYNSNYTIREKRAVFFQNIWRDTHSKTLRTDYHERFETNEYQNAKQAGKLNKFVNYYFTHNDIPQ
ncbi:MAG: hypothetical protein GQ583_08160 [Methyloprofundus sp.]|nr:hypothetical protein [Methyloprofundus sp.]